MTGNSKARPVAKVVVAKTPMYEFNVGIFFTISWAEKVPKKLMDKGLIT